MASKAAWPAWPLWLLVGGVLGFLMEVANLTTLQRVAVIVVGLSILVAVEIVKEARR